MYKIDGGGAGGWSKNRSIGQTPDPKYFGPSAVARTGLQFYNFQQNLYISRAGLRLFGQSAAARTG